jgi:WD40 repeat protein
MKHQLAKGKSEWVSGVAFAPDGQTVALGSTRSGRGEVIGEVLLWDTQTGAIRQTLPSPSKQVSAVAFSPDGRWLVGASGEGSVRFWDFPKGERSRTLQVSDQAVRAIAFSADGKMLATGSQDQRVQVWAVAKLLDE